MKATGSNQIVFPFNFITHSSCLQIARAFGASEIIAVDVLDEKLQKAKTFGATHTVNSAKEDPIEKINVYAFLFCHAVYIFLESQNLFYKIYSPLSNCCFNKI